MSNPAKVDPKPPLSLNDPAAIAELGDVLRSLGYNGAQVREALGTEGEILARAAEMPLHERRLAGDEPLATLIKLLILELPVTPEAAARALAPLPLERLTALGIVDSSRDLVQTRVRIVPHDELLIASDRRLVPGSPPQTDHVAGVHHPSVTLANLTVRRPVAAALEVGTGCGVQAILTARHAERVVATDVNERALNFAAFNATLNGITNVEFPAGSFFEPVEGSRFGLVISNPPYVISPESDYLFRDSGLPGDSVSRGVVERAPSFLEENGFATVLVAWAHAADEDWSTPLRKWVAQRGCDAWLLHFATEDPLTHAGNWNRENYAHDSKAFAQALDRWVAYFDRLGIEAIAHGAIVLRKRSGRRNWVRADEVPPGRLTAASDHIRRVFAAQDFLEQLTDERALLDQRFELAHHDMLQQRVVLREGKWIVEAITLELEEGLGFRAEIDRHTVRMLASLDGHRTLGELANGLATSIDADTDDREQLVNGILPVFRSMLELGYLTRTENL
jgi:hypothetical protein